MKHTFWRYVHTYSSGKAKHSVFALVTMSHIFHRHVMFLYLVSYSALLGQIAL